MLFAAAVVGLATRAVAFAPRIQARSRSGSAVLAQPRFVDGPNDIDEACKIASYMREGRGEGVALAVLYFSSLNGAHAAPLATFELLGAALPDCEFLLAVVEKDKRCFGAFDRLDGVDTSTSDFDPVVEVLFKNKRVALVPVGAVASTLSELGFTPRTTPKTSLGAAADKSRNLGGDALGARLGGVDGDLWERSAASRAEPRPQTPPPTNRRAEKAARTTNRFVPGPGQDAPPGMGETIEQVRRREDDQMRAEYGLPPASAKKQQKQEDPGSIKAALDKFGADVQKQADKIGQNFNKLGDDTSSGKKVDSSGKKVDKAGPDPGFSFVDRKAQQDKLERMFKL